MFVANQDTRNVAVFSIDEHTGGLEQVAVSDVGCSPTCVIVVAAAPTADAACKL